MVLSGVAALHVHLVLDTFLEDLQQETGAPAFPVRLLGPVAQLVRAHP
jgi:hypothetical protein